LLFRCYVKFICIFKLFPELTTSVRAAYAGRTQRVVISLLVDDGVPGRGHRKSLLDGAFKAVGVATGNHPNYTEMCVVEMAGGFQDK
jgi:uncharacterized protein YkwD